MKKLSLSIGVALLAASQAVAYDFMEGKFAFNKLTDETVEITRINDDVATNNDSYVSLYTDDVYRIPETVTHDGVTYTITKIGRAAFDSSPLKELYLSDKVTYLDVQSFNRCANLAVVEMPKVEEIWGYVFGGCYSLHELVIPETMKNLNGMAFPGRDLSTGVAPKHKLTLECDPGAVNNSWNDRYVYDGIEELIFTSKVPAITSRSPFGFSGLKTITFEESVLKLDVGSMPFITCKASRLNIYRPLTSSKPEWLTFSSSIKEVHLGNFEPFEIGAPSATVAANCTIYVYADQLDAYKNDANWSKFANILVEPGTDVPEPDETYGFNYTLNEEAKTAEIIAAGDVVDPYTGDIVIPESLKVGGKLYTVTSIGNSAFRETGITSLKLPSTIKEIKQGAFQMCYDLKTIELNEGLETLGWDVFNNTRALEQITIPGSIKTIPANAFGFSGLKTVIVNPGVEVIKDAFNKCLSLTTISLPETLVELDGSFQDCTALKEIELPSSLRTIGWFTFANTGITELVINEGIEKLDMQSLGMMNGDYNADYTLKKVILPSTLKEIHKMALNNRRGLTDVIVLATVPPTAGDFAEYVYNATLTVPDGTVDAYKAAAGWKNFSTIKEADKVVDLDASKVRYSVGEGANKYVLRVSFNNPRRLDNITWGYLADEAMADPTAVLAAVAEADKRLTVTGEGDNLSISFDLISDGEINDRDVTAAGAWTVTNNTLAADGITRVISFSYNGSDKGLDYDFFAPEPDAEGVWLPEAMTVKLSDEGCVIPALVQVPNGKLNSTTNWQASSSNTSFRLDRTKIITPYTLIDETYNAIPTFVGTTGTTYVRYRPQKTGAYAYYESNFMTLNIEAPEVPVTAINVAEEKIQAGLNKTVEVEYSFEPANATYTAVKFTPADTKVATWSATAGLKSTTKAGETTVTVESLYDPEVKTTFTLETVLLNPVTAVNFGPGTEDGVINVPVRQLIGLKPVIVPADADITDVTITLSDNGTSKADYTCSTYKVNWWDVNNVRSQFFELSGHRPTGDHPAKLHVVSADGAYERDFVVNVIEADRTPRENGYVDGTIILNEEWFGHTNGGLNYFTEDDEIIYQAYEKENPGMAFGATSQYGTIWAGKLIVASKQAQDGGDPLPGGGRLVIADAKTLKRLGSLDNLTWDGASGDGRAVAGATPTKIYVGSSNGIYIVDITNPAEPVITGRIGKENSTDLYSGQIGDMTTACGHVFAVMQSNGLIIINVNDDTTTQIADANIQGVTQSADGNVWYATIQNGSSVFVALDPETLEEVDRVTMPAAIGTVACGWGAWRSTAFHGSPKTNDLWFVTGAAGVMGGASGDYYRYHIGDDPATIKPFFSLANVTGINGFDEEVGQMTYGTPRYDDRNDRLVVMAGKKGAASGGYRDHWVHYVDGTTGEITKTFHLNPYYWFQSLPIFPDKYAAEIELENDEITIDTADDPLEIDLSEAITDRDSHERNINLKLVEAEAETKSAAYNTTIANISLEGRKLTVTPVSDGNMSFTLAAESNGVVTNKTIAVTVKTGTGIDSVNADSYSIKAIGRRIYVEGAEGHTLNVYNAAGMHMAAFDIDSPSYIVELNVTAGVYVAEIDGAVTKVVLH